MEFPSVVLIIIAVLVIRGSVAEKSERRDMGKNNNKSVMGGLSVGSPVGG